MMVIGLLGEVTAAGAELGPARQRCVLAALAVDAGRVVPLDRLAGRVWGPDLPPRPRSILPSYISRLRAALAGAELHFALCAAPAATSAT